MKTKEQIQAEIEILKIKKQTINVFKLPNVPNDGEFRKAKEEAIKEVNITISAFEWVLEEIEE